MKKAAPPASSAGGKGGQGGKGGDKKDEVGSHPGEEEGQHEAAEPDRTFKLPPEVAARNEAQESFCEENNSYPLNGRPFGLAFVWGNSYQDDTGNVQCMIATDSAGMVGEVLQQAGFEVRVRLNVRKKYILDELAAENVEDELKDRYDCVLCYFCGRGDGDSFMTQYEETITVAEVWEALDAVGFKGKPRIMVMDLFDVRSTYGEDFAEDVGKLKADLDGATQDLTLLKAKGGSPPEMIVKRVAEMEENYNAKVEEQKNLRKVPNPGIQARVAIIGVPITGGVVSFTVHVKKLAYAVSFGVCDQKGLSKVWGVKLRSYCGMSDFLGADQYGWAFNQVGRSFHNEYKKAGKPSWGKVIHVREGDKVTVTIDTFQGVLRMDVPGKFKGTQTKLLHPGLLNLEDRGVTLYPSVCLYECGDTVEIIGVKVGTVEDGPTGGDMKPYGGRVAWDRRLSAPGLACEGKKLRRGEGLNLPKDPDACVIISRQPCKWAPRFITERGNASGEMFLSIYDLEPDETEGISLFTFLFMQELKQGVIDHTGECFTERCVANIKREMDEYAMRCWLRSNGGLDGKQLQGVVLSMLQARANVDMVKYVTDKAELDNLGIKNRSFMDSVFQATIDARNESTWRVQKLSLTRYCTFPEGKKLILSCPPVVWSAKHHSAKMETTAEVAAKFGQTPVSCMAVCSLESELRCPRQYGTLLPGGGKHSWTWTIKELRSSQEEETGRERRETAGLIRLGVIKSAAVKRGTYSVTCGRARGGTTTTVTLESGGSSDVDGYYEGMQCYISEGRGAGQISRIFGYTAEDQTIDVMYETDPDASSFYVITRLDGFEVGDDDDSWGVSSSTAGRAAAMHGNPNEGTFKALKYQGEPHSVNRVTSMGFEQDGTYPRFLGNALQEGDVVTAYLDLEGQNLGFTVNNERLGEAIQGITGPVVPAMSVSSTTDCVVTVGQYRRWAPHSGWGKAGEEDMGLEAEELDELKNAFRMFQREGVIVLADLRDTLTQIGWVGTDAEMQEIVENVDIDGSGSLDQTEFLQLMVGMKEDGTWFLGMAQDKQRRATGAG